VVVISYFSLSSFFFLSDFSALLVDIVLSFDVLFHLFVLWSLWSRDAVKMFMSLFSSSEFHSISRYLFYIFISILHNFVLEYGNIIVSFFLARFVFL
jgi:hypothetical protein